ncbi:MAG: hypothetical protein AAB316_16700 [Bacteroidota bacterium]
MKILVRFPVFILAFLIFSSAAFAQAFISTKIEDDTLAKLKVVGLPVLPPPLAGDPVSPHYKYLWVFGDGTFINATRSDTAQHWFDGAPADKRYHSTGQIDMAVYATDAYSGGTRPPKSTAPPPSVDKKLTAVTDITLGTTTPVNPFRISTGNIKVQLNQAIRPEDTTVAIISIRNPFSFPLPDGKVFLFFNSSLKRTPITVSSKNQVKVASSPAPPPPAFGNFRYNKSMIFYNTMPLQAGKPTAPIPLAQVLDNYKDMVMITYPALAPGEQRNLFYEFKNDSLMWNFISGTEIAEVNFLALHALTYFPTDANFPVDSVQFISDDFTTKAGLNALLTGYLFNQNPTDNSVTITPNPVGQGLTNSIIGYSVATSSIVKEHDPNHLTLYGCECPGSSKRKLYGVVDFTNDGGASVTKTTVTMELPPQLDPSSLQLVDHKPNTDSSVEKIEQSVVGNKVTWTLPAFLNTPLEAGFGDSSTLGFIVFSIDLNEGFEPSQVDSMSACVNFNDGEVFCTPRVSAVLTDSSDKPAQVVLQCEKCEKGGGSSVWIICILLLLLIILVLAAFRFWFWRRRQ